MAKANSELRVFAPALTLLVMAVLINYVDRGNLSLAAPILKNDWGLSASQLGILFSAFYWTYVPMQMVVGWLVDRFSVAIVMAIGVLVWSLATAIIGLATGFADNCDALGENGNADVRPIFVSRVGGLTPNSR